MLQKDFTILLNNVNDIIKPLNQLLYESLILILIYYFFNSISNTNGTNGMNSNHKSFIILVALISIIINWFIWNNYLQTILFTAILIIYISYNFYLAKQISTFIDMVNDSKAINKQNDTNITNYNNQLLEDQKQIDMITFVPKDIIMSNGNPRPTNLEAYDKNLNNINSLKLAYQETIPKIHITDSKYAEIMLNDLYGTPQYKNINTNCIDKSLDNDIHNQGVQGVQGVHDFPDTNRDVDVDLFRTPKKIFLDNEWLSKKENTYNDNCGSKCKGGQEGNSDENSDENMDGNGKRNKNAICYVAKFGRELNECTNSYYVNEKQLTNISNNDVPKIKGF